MKKADGGQQFVRVAHVPVNDGGQAVIGSIMTHRASGALELDDLGAFEALLAGIANPGHAIRAIKGLHTWHSSLLLTLTGRGERMACRDDSVTSAVHPIADISLRRTK